MHRTKGSNVCVNAPTSRITPSQSKIKAQSLLLLPADMRSALAARPACRGGDDCCWSCAAPCGLQVESGDDGTKKAWVRRREGKASTRPRERATVRVVRMVVVGRGIIISCVDGSKRILGELGETGKRRGGERKATKPAPGGWWLGEVLCACGCAMGGVRGCGGGGQMHA